MWILVRRGRDSICCAWRSSLVGETTQLQRHRMIEGMIVADGSLHTGWIHRGG